MAEDEQDRETPPLVPDDVRTHRRLFALEAS